jgi:acyl CoA:acetate/3-ketoacid CoA transferase beta subunit
MPLTGYGVKTIITEKAVFEVTPDGLVLTELAPELTIEELKKVTDADFTQAPNVIAYRMVQ